ncbi:MAG: tyrosine-type recombinase/integrase [Flavobacteriales bacterium]|nr:tyrosine-type recombinase/integrase [Flavobacteriales bacterium]
MQVSKLQSENGRSLFRVYESGLPYDDVNEFLRHLEYRDLAPNTVKAYAFDLIKYFEYLAEICCEWADVDLDKLCQYIHVLRYAVSEKVSLISSSETQLRSERSISRMMSAVLSFYRYQHFQNGILANLADKGIFESSRSGKYHTSFLSFAKAAKPKTAKRSSITLSSWKQKVASRPKTLEANEQKKLVGLCVNRRDKLLILLLIETGMRIGQVLQLKHTDIESWNKRLLIKHRLDNPNEVYSKSRHEYAVDLSNNWLEMYTDYIIYEQSDIDSEYVFTALYRKDGGDTSAPLSYARIKTIFNALSKKSGIHVTPHMFRHTHATELLREEVPIEIVAKRLGHRSLETTRQMYEHLTAADMRKILSAHLTKSSSKS